MIKLLDRLIAIDQVHKDLIGFSILSTEPTLTEDIVYTYRNIKDYVLRDIEFDRNIYNNLSKAIFSIEERYFDLFNKIIKNRHDEYFRSDEKIFTNVTYNEQGIQRVIFDSTRINQLGIKLLENILKDTQQNG